jgi:hypothetical protein
MRALKDGYPIDLNRIAHDTLYGPISVVTNAVDGWVEITGDTIPPVTIEREPGAEPDRTVRLGSRDQDHITLLLDGTPLPLHPGRTGWSRRSHRVRVEHAGTILQLRPVSDASSRLLCGRRVFGPLRTRRRLGKFSEKDPKSFTSHWYRWSRRPTPEEAALGYALAAAFGSGADTLIGLDIDF